MAKAQQIRIKNEFQLLYVKKLNKDLYQLHIHNTNTWQTL